MKITTKISYDKDGRKVHQPIMIEGMTGISFEEIWEREYDCEILSPDEYRFKESPVGAELFDE